jgi:hypothetical protein
MIEKILAVTLLLVVAVGMHITTVGAANGTSATVIAVSAPPATPAGASPSLPPNRVADCINFALLDEMCTKRWYTCKRGGSDVTGCIDAFESCCTLRGQGARSRLGGAEAVSTNR